MPKITTSKQLIEAALDVAKNYKTLYVMGCFGSPMTASNKKRFTTNHEYNKGGARTAMINAASTDTFGFDCVCLIKGLLWGWSGDKNKSYGGAVYASNGVPDIDVSGLMSKCSPSTNFKDIQPGEVVSTLPESHIGIYVGDGLVVECTPRWTNGVLISNLGNLPEYKRGSYRLWTNHGKLPYISYTELPKPLSSFKKNDVVKVTGSKYFGGATVPAWVKASTWYVHSVRADCVIINESTDGKHAIMSSVRDQDLQLATAESTSWTPKVGEIVMFNGTGHYASASSAVERPCKSGKAKITQIYRLGQSLHPYLLVRVSGEGSTVYGWVDRGTFTQV